MCTFIGFPFLNHHIPTTFRPEHARVDAEASNPRTLEAASDGERDVLNDFYMPVRQFPIVYCAAQPLLHLNQIDLQGDAATSLPYPGRPVVESELPRRRARYKRSMGFCYPPTANVQEGRGHDCRGDGPL